KRQSGRACRFEKTGFVYTAESGQLVIGGTAAGALELAKPGGEDGPRVSVVGERFLPPSSSSPEFSGFCWRHVPVSLLAAIVAGHRFDRRLDPLIVGLKINRCLAFNPPRRHIVVTADAHCAAARSIASRIRKERPCVFASRIERHLVPPDVSRVPRLPGKPAGPCPRLPPWAWHSPAEGSPRAWYPPALP